MIEWITNLDLAILDFIQNTFRCDFLDTVVPYITSFADKGIGWIAVAVILLCFKKTRKTGLMVGVALILGLIFGNGLLKNLFARTRPYDLPGVQIDLLVERLSDFSFPSGHTLASFEAAVVLMIRDKRFGIPALVLAVLIALTRLYLYVHFPTDVLAGALLGTLFAFIAVCLVDKVWNKAELKLAEIKK